MKTIICFSLLFAVSYASLINIKNNCGYTIWPGILANPGYPIPEGGGFELGSKQSKVLNVGDKWQGRVWARTGCDAKGNCETGDCGARIQCQGNGGRPPCSLAEITFAGHADLDYYDISLVDGYNLPIRMVPTGGFKKTNPNNKYDCNPTGCHADLNTLCPPELSQKSGGRTVACYSACMKLDTDQYCCRGKHNQPHTCKSSDWPKNYPAIFKQACPDAYSYAYDDTTSTFVCRGAPHTNYDVIFCP